MAGSLSVAAHLAILFGLASAFVIPPKPFEPAPMLVQLITLAPPANDPARAPAPAKPAPPKPPPPKALARKAPPRPDVVPLPAGKGSTADTTAEVSDAQLASAANAGAGLPGGACDMGRRLQAALRRDRLVQAAVADARRESAGKALWVWNGDWVRSYGQDGEGLAAVREAMMWEIAFAPEACRAESVHGMVQFSLNDGAGPARLVVGAGDWRWSDLLRSRFHASGMARP